MATFRCPQSGPQTRFPVELSSCRVNMNVSFAMGEVNI